MTELAQSLAMSLKAVSKYILALERGARLGHYLDAQGPRAGRWQALLGAPP